MAEPQTIPNLVAELHRQEWGRLLAAMIADLGYIELAEDCLQDAFAKALSLWRTNERPKSPSAWLYRTARNLAVDRIRRQENWGRKEEELMSRAARIEQQLAENTDYLIQDQRLQLMFTCCHPALEESSQVALTLHTLGGLTTQEIAMAFLTSDSTMAQRLVRAKRKIRTAGIPFGLPEESQIPERRSAVLAVLYFIFNEGYSAHSGTSPLRSDLVDEALRLAKLTARLLPRDAEVAGLLSLMLLHDSRREARFENHRPIPLDCQDRSRWKQEQIQRGVSILEGALKSGRLGPYQLQAAISAVHAEAESFAATDWKQIVLLYQRLELLTQSVVVRLNRAVAESFAFGVDIGLQRLEEVEAAGGLENYQPYFAALADTLRRAGRTEEAIIAYERALELTTNLADRLFLNDRVVALRAAESS